MPGLVRGVARTAVVAGTATAVSNRVSRRQAGRWSQQEAQSYNQPPPQQYAAPAPAAPARPSTDDKFAQLKELGELKQAGILTDAEFEAQKALILAS
jgi:putative oligomerization/nucleic acid binding protein